MESYGDLYTKHIIKNGQDAVVIFVPTLPQAQFSLNHLVSVSLLNFYLVPGNYMRIGVKKLTYSQKIMDLKIEFSSD